MEIEKKKGEKKVKILSFYIKGDFFPSLLHQTNNHHKRRLSQASQSNMKNWLQRTESKCSTIPSEP